MVRGQWREVMGYVDGLLVGIRQARSMIRRDWDSGAETMLNTVSREMPL